MAERTTKQLQLNVKVSAEELARVRALQARLQTRYGPNVRITTRTVLLEALSTLETYYDRLEKDKARLR